MDIFTVLVITVISITTLFFILDRHKRKRLPPSPERSLPILGHLLTLDIEDSRRQMQKWREQVGDIFSLYMGSTLVIVLNGYDNIKEAFVKGGDNFAGRPFNYFEWASNTPNKGIVFSSGSNWKEQRTVSLGILRSMGMGKNVLAERIQEEISRYLKHLAQSDGKAQDVRVMTNISVSNVICSILVGQRFGYDDIVFKGVIERLNYTLSNLLGIGPFLVQTFPLLHYLPGNLLGIKPFLKNKKELRDIFCHHFIDLKGSKEYNDETIDNFIASYVNEKNRREKNGQQTNLTETNLLVGIEDLLIAGTETTTTALNWFILYMINYPEIQKKMFNEINSEIGIERAPTMHDKSNLKYVNAVIMESQRISNPNPLGLPHETCNDIHFKGFQIPKGTTVLANYSSIFFDKNIWGQDVDTFRPERFIDEMGNVKHFEEFVPFSLGRRACIGEALAKMELFLYVSSLCQRFQMLPADPSCPPKIQARVNATRNPVPFEVRLVERN